MEMGLGDSSLSLASASTNLFVESGSKHPQIGGTANSVFPDAPTLNTEQFQSFLLEQLMRRKLFTKAANTEMPNTSCSVSKCCYVIFTWFYFSLFLDGHCKDLSHCLFYCLV